MFYYLSEFADTYNNSSWRESRDKKREIDRVTVQKMIAHRTSWEAIQQEYWLLARYADLGFNDRELVRQLFSRNRKIADHHLELSPDEWEEFVEGRLLPATAGSLIRDRLRAREKDRAQG